MKKNILLFSVLFLFGTVISHAQIINTIAGNASGSYYGDGGPATAAELHSPMDLVVDGAGNIYVADYNNNRIREVFASSGRITTIAGNGFAGYAGDGGTLAITAELNGPSGIDLVAGNLYIADQLNERIRKVILSSGKIYTVAGSGNQGYSGDGGGALSAELFFPESVAVDDTGNIFIADTYNHIIREVYVSQGLIATIAGIPGTASYNGQYILAYQAELNFPKGVRVDESDNVFIADYGNNLIREVVAAKNNLIINIAGTPQSAGYSGDGGPALSAQLSGPEGICLDNSGNIYIADFGNNRIREVNVSTGYINLIAGNGVPAWSGDGGPAVAAELRSCAGVAVDASGSIYIADDFNSRVRKVNSILGINQLAMDYGQWSVYPNPSNGQLTIDNGHLTMNNGKTQLEVYNLFGQKIFTQLSIVHYPLSIDLSSQPNGIYFYRVVAEDGSLEGEGKMVIQK